MTKEQLFLKTVKFVKEKYKLNFKISRDNRLKRTGVYSYKGEYILIYSKKSLYSLNDTIWAAYHECGHIKNDLPYKTLKDEIYSEYKAERWALTKLKIDYPKIYKYRLKEGKKELKGFINSKYEPYLSAWKMIKEYN